jgi:hypothetical protein
MGFNRALVLGKGVNISDAFLQLFRDATCVRDVNQPGEYLSREVLPLCAGAMISHKVKNYYDRP